LTEAKYKKGDRVRIRLPRPNKNMFPSITERMLLLNGQTTKILRYFRSVRSDELNANLYKLEIDKGSFVWNERWLIVDHIDCCEICGKATSEKAVEYSNNRYHLECFMSKFYSSSPCNSCDYYKKYKKKKR